MSLKKRVDFFYDILSPYAYLGFEVICRYNTSDLWNMNLTLKPYLLGAVMKAVGSSAPSYCPNKVKYAWIDLKRQTEYYQVPIKIPSTGVSALIKKGSMQSQRFLTAVDMEEPQSLENVSRELYKRIWTKDEEINDELSLRQAGREAGLSDDTISLVLLRMKDQDVKDRLRQYTQEALDNKAFGSPTIIAHVNNKQEMIFGSDRFEILAMLLEEDWKGPLPSNTQK